MKSALKNRVAMIGIAAVMAACGGLPGEDRGVADLDGENQAQTHQGLPWSSADAPSIFTADLEYQLDKLPQTGAARNTPWPGSYWASYQDSINFRWNGPTTDAPSTKYAKAFGVTGVEDAVSRMRGIASYSGGTACTTDAPCKTAQGEVCAKREGQTSGWCVAEWHGICHAWSPAAILTQEPAKPVTHNGVTFKVNDIKALVSLVHDNVVTKFVSLRCNQDQDAGKIEYDEYGRPKTGDCMDTNPATMHLLVTNYLGIKGSSFVMDRTFDDEVWNHPLRAYRITLKKEVTGEEANRLVGVTTPPVSGGTTTRLTADLAAGAWKHFAPVTVTAGTPLRVTMNGTGDADLYVRFGGQPAEQTYDCRPYADGSSETCSLTVPTAQTQAYVSVNGYTASKVTLDVVTGGTTGSVSTYRFNPSAKRFFEMRMELDYIDESDSSTDGPLVPVVGTFTRTERYHYVLELDDQGRLLGGEWLDASKQAHPDFLWLPVRVDATTVAEGKIRVADVMMLLNASLNKDDNPTGTTVPRTAHEQGSLTAGQWKQYGPYNVAAGAKLVATMTGSGDADLYVRVGSAPTASSYTCRPYQDGSAESCTVSGPGAIYVAVNGYVASSFSLDLSWAEPAGSTPPVEPPPPATQHLNVSGQVALGQFAFHTVAVTAGKAIVVRTTAPNDIDVYLQMGQQPTTTSSVAAGESSTGQETVRYVPTTTGTLHIGVYGYRASSFTLTTADQ